MPESEEINSANLENEPTKLELDLFFDCSLDLLVLVGFDNRFKQVSPSFERVLGWTKEEVISKQFYDFLHPDDIEKTQAVFRAHETGKNAVLFVNRYRCKDGSYRWISWNSHPLTEKQIIVGIGRDITERKKAEDSLQNTERLLSAVTDGSSDAIYVKDCQSRWLFVNPAIERITGKPSSELLGKNDLEIYANPEIGKTMMANDLRVMKSGKAETIEETVESTNGLRHFISDKVPRFDDNGQVIGLIGISSDITERKKAEEVVKSSKLLLESVFNSMYEGVFILDKTGKVIDFNDAFCRINKFKNRADTLRSISSLGTVFKAYRLDGSYVPVEDWPATKALQGKSGYDEEFIVERTDLGERWITSNSYAPLRNETGEIVGAIQTMYDITERKKAEENLRKLYRHQKAMSNSNQALMHAADENLLTQEICDIIVNDCGYALVWVGFAQHDQHKTVCPVAFAGFDKGYIDSLRVTWDENLKSGRGPTGTVIRTGKPFICKNMQIDPNFEPWRSEALKRGFTASLVLPLISFEGETFGGLNIYSKEQDPFTDEEVNLLTELANDFEYGISMLRLRKKREQDEETLRKQSSLVDLSPDAIIAKKIDDTITFWNQGAQSLYGWTKDEAVGQKSRVLLKTKFPEPYEEILNQLTCYERWSGEKTHQTKSGRGIVVDSRWLATFDRQGKITEILENNVDITERKKAEDALSKKQEELQTIFDSSQGLIFYKDLENHFIRVNKAFAEIMGLPKEQLEGRSLFELYPNEEAEAFWSDDKQVIASGKAKVGIEEKMQSKHGQRWVQTDKIPYRDVEGNIIGVIGFSVDITERKKAEEALARINEELEARVQKRTQEVSSERQRLYNVLETLPAYVVLLDKDYRMPFANKVFRETFGESHGRRCHEYLFGRDSECENCETYKVLKTNKPQHWEWTGPNKHDYEIYDYPFVEADGSTLILEMGIDVTERKKAERVAQEAAKKLKDSERLAAIGATAGMVGHDIRNPLQGMTSDVYLAKTELASLPESEEKKNALESLDEIQKNIDYVNKIVADLQDFARPLNPRAQETDVESVFNDILEKYGIPKNIKVTVEVEDKAEKIMADPDYLKRIAANLTLNAVQAMPEGGKLTIHTYVDKATDEVLITVKDTGVGIPEDIKPKLFTPMMTTKSKGQGFGLAVVKRMTEGLGGTVTFESEEGKGTTFIVRLPPQRAKR